MRGKLGGVSVSKKFERFIDFLVFTVREQKRREVLNALEILQKYKDAPLKLEIERKKKRRKPLSPKVQEKLRLLEFRAKLYERAKRIIEEYAEMKRRKLGRDC